MKKILNAFRALFTRPAPPTLCRRSAPGWWGMSSALERLLAVSSLAALSACGQVSMHNIVQDKNGCEWEVVFRVHQMGGDVVGFDDVKPRLDRDGKQICALISSRDTSS